jgi:thiamine-monophosphate kinase
VQALGLVEPGTALLRSGGRAGDLLYVSGTPGDAAAGLRIAMGGLSGGTPEQRRALLERFHFPEPRVALGRALRGIASACIDVSDGLAADAMKLAAASGCGLRIEAGQLPLSDALLAVVDAVAAREFALNGGDDYELCFTVPPGNEARLRVLLEDVKCAVTCIGMLEEHAGLRLFDEGVETGFAPRGFDHFP